MDLLDVFMPQAAQASHLRDIASALRSGQVAARGAKRAATGVQNDVGTVGLVCMALVAALIEKGVISELDLQMQLQALDGLDAVDDGALDPNVLRGKLGLKLGPAVTAPLPRKPRRPG